MKLWQPIVARDSNCFTMHSRPQTSSQANQQKEPYTSQKSLIHISRPLTNLRQRVPTTLNLNQNLRFSYNFQPQYNSNLMLVGMQFKEQVDQQQKQLISRQLQLIQKKQIKLKKKQTIMQQKANQMVNVQIPDLIINKYEINKKNEVPQFQNLKLAENQKIIECEQRQINQIRKTYSQKFLLGKIQSSRVDQNKINFITSRRHQDTLTPRQQSSLDSEFFFSNVREKLCNEKQSQNMSLKNLRVQSLYKQKLLKYFLNDLEEPNRNKFSKSQEGFKSLQSRELNNNRFANIKYHTKQKKNLTKIIFHKNDLQEKLRKSINPLGLSNTNTQNFIKLESEKDTFMNFILHQHFIIYKIFSYIEAKIPLFKLLNNKSLYSVLKYISHNFKTSKQR